MSKEKEYTALDSDHKLYDRLVEHSIRFIPSGPSDSFTSTNEGWIHDRAGELYCHHMILDMWKPRIVKTALSKPAKDLFTK